MSTAWMLLVMAAVLCTPRDAKPIFGISLSDILRPLGGRQPPVTTTTTTTTTPPCAPAECGLTSTTTDEPRNFINVPRGSCPPGQRWAAGMCRVDIGRR